HRSVPPRRRDPPGIAPRHQRGAHRRWGHRPAPDGEWGRSPGGPSGGEGLRLIRELLADLEPHVYAAGLSPGEFRAATFHDLHAVIRAHYRRQARELDAMAWLVAHLLVGGGTLRRGTRVHQLMHDLLGRAPGTVPGEALAPTRELSPAATAAYLVNWVHTTGG